MPCEPNLDHERKEKMLDELRENGYDCEIVKNSEDGIYEFLNVSWILESMKPL